MVKLYETSMERGSIDEPCDRYLIGQKIGLHKTAVDTICKLLAQANFIKKAGPVDVFVTPHGLKLVQQILGISNG